MKEAILGVTDNDLVNHCISLCAVVRIICSSRIPSIFALLGSLEGDRKGEEYNAIVSGRFQGHKTKWSPIEFALKQQGQGEFVCLLGF